MKKLTLELEALAVETFETAGATAEDRGTVFAQAKTDRDTCADTCGVNRTCIPDCYWTLWETCGVTQDAELC